jgi:acyl-CoA thioesterase FadM
MSAPNTKPVSTTISRRIEWIDTDAAGIYHWTTAMRLAEAAGAELHTQLGIAAATFGCTPRVHVRFDFHRSLKFNDLVDVTIRVLKVGRSSVVQLFVLEHDGEICAEGEIVVCYINRFSGRSAPWPDPVREALTHGVAQPSSASADPR